MKKPLSMSLQVILLVGFLGLGLVAFVSRDHITDMITTWSGNQPESQTKRSRGRAIPVIVSRVIDTRNDEIVSAVGTARAKRSVVLQAKADGIIIVLNANAGSSVKQGDVLCELDSAKAKLAVQIAEKRHQEALRLVERSRLLKSRNVGSDARVIDAVVLAERAELEVQLAKETLRDLKIIAPFDGIVGLPNVEVGDRVTATTPIVSLDDQRDLLIEFEVPEKFAVQINVGDEISAITPSHQRTRFKGRIEYIDNRVNPASRTVKVRAVIPNKTNILRPGMSFAVELRLPGAVYAAVPELSLQWRKGESYIWVVRQSKAEKVLVRAVKRLNSIVLIEGDVAKNELVVVEGVQRLRQGRPVEFNVPSLDKNAEQDVPKQSKFNQAGPKG